MPAALLSLILNPKVLGGIGLALLIAFAGIQTARLGNAKRDQIDQTTHQSWRSEEIRDSKALAAANRDLAICKANQQTLEASLTRQNAAVAALQAAGAQATARATKAAHDALIATKQASDLAVTILAPHPDHSCAAAEALISESVK